MSIYRCLFIVLKVHIINLKIQLRDDFMQEMDLREIGKRIHHRRKQQGYTQEQLAEMMNVSIQMISNLERGNKAIRIDNLIRLSQILQVSTDYILTGRQNAEDQTALTAQISRLSDRDRKMIELLMDYCASDED